MSSVADDLRQVLHGPENNLLVERPSDDLHIELHSCGAPRPLLDPAVDEVALEVGVIFKGRLIGGVRNVIFLSTYILTSSS